MLHPSKHASPTVNAAPATAPGAQVAFYSLVAGAESLMRQGCFIEAELKLTELLSWAKKNFGQNSDQVKLVHCITAAFYRQTNRGSEASEIEERMLGWSEEKAADKKPIPAVTGLKSTFERLKPTVEPASKATSTSEPGTPQPAREPLPEKSPGLGATLNQRKPANGSEDTPGKPHTTLLPGNVRKACQILGIPRDSELTPALVQNTWKKQLLNHSAHPDLGGNTDEAVLLNKAKTELMEYLDFIKPRQRSSWKLAESK